MPRNPDRNYAIHWVQGAGDSAVTAALAGATGTGTDPGPAEGEVYGDVVGALLGPLFVQGIHGDELTPPALTGDTDDFDPDGRDALLWRLDLAGFALTGIAVDTGGWHVLAALTAGSLTHEDAASAAANRLLIPGGDLTLAPDDMALAIYDATSERWRIGPLTAGGGLTAGSYTISNPTTDRVFDADSLTVNELADIVATLIADLGGT